MVNLSWEFWQGNNWWPMESEFSAVLTYLVTEGRGGLFFVHDYGKPTGETQDKSWGLVGCVEYSIDFNTMLQKNHQTGRTRHVRFIQVIAGWPPTSSDYAEL